MALLDRIKSVLTGHESGVDAACATDVDLVTVIDQDEYDEARRDPAVIALYERAAQQAAEYERSHAAAS